MKPIYSDVEARKRRSESGIRWQKKNIEKVREYRREWERKNKERRKIQRALRKQENPEISREIFRRYQKNHRTKINVLASRYRAKFIRPDAIHPQSLKEEEIKLHELALTLSKTTGIQHVVDHIIPLNCGGWHHHLNLQVIPVSINCSKHGNPIWEHEGYKSWRDVPEYLWPEKLVNIYKSILKL